MQTEDEFADTLDYHTVSSTKSSAPVVSNRSFQSLQPVKLNVEQNQVSNGKGTSTSMVSSQRSSATDPQTPGAENASAHPATSNQLSSSFQMTTVAVLEAAGQNSTPSPAESSKGSIQPNPKTAHHLVSSDQDLPKRSVRRPRLFSAGDKSTSSRAAVEELASNSLTQVELQSIADRNLSNGSTQSSYTMERFNSDHVKTQVRCLPPNWPACLSPAHRTIGSVSDTDC
eukprot:1186324-Prorocentrum_minimum.AAC.3